MTRSIFIRSRKNAFAIAAAGALVAAAGAVALAAPAQAEAAESHANQVHVIIENNTLTIAKGAEWSGKLVDTWTTLKPGDTALTEVEEAAQSVGATITHSKTQYGEYVSGVADAKGASLNAGTHSSNYYDGWSLLLNDWMTSTSIDNYKVSDKTLSAGDELVFAYSLNGGPDLGGDFGNNDKSLKALKITGAKLSSGFKSTKKKYTIYRNSNKTKNIYVTPTAANKNFQVRTTVGKKTYKRTQAIPVKLGTVIKVKDGDPSWPTMNSAANVPAQTYTINVKAAKGYTTTVKGAKYQVTNASKNYVTYVKAPKNKKTVSVPNTVKIGGTSYKVIKIATKAFSNNKKVKTVKVGKNVAKISKSAFSKVPNLKKISVSSKHLKAKSTVKSAFKGSKLKKNLTVNANQIATKYVKKSFTKKNLKTPKKVVLTRTVTNI